MYKVYEVDGLVELAAFNSAPEACRYVRSLRGRGRNVYWKVEA